MPSQKPKIVYWKSGITVRARQVYLDANFLVGLAWPTHIWNSTALGLLHSLQLKKTGLILSSLAFNEAVYQLVKLDRQEQNVNHQDREASNSNLWPDRLNEAVLKLENLVYFEAPDAAFHRQTVKAIAELGLDPTDAFHYAAARNLNCPLVSNDAGFQKIPDQNLTIVTFY